MRVNTLLIGKRINQTIAILNKKNLPYTFDEVSQVVHYFNCDMDQIKEFVDGYEKSVN